MAASRVDIRIGRLSGDTHAAGYDNNVLRQIVANASLQETVTTSNRSAGQWAVATAVFGGSGGINNRALSAGTFSFRVNDTSIQSSFNPASGWGYPNYSDSNPNSFAVIDAFGGGFRVELHVLIPSNRQLVFDSGVRSESRATGRISTGPSVASQVTLANLYLSLPAGVTCCTAARSWPASASGAWRCVCASVWRRWC